MSIRIVLFLAGLPVFLLSLFFNTAFSADVRQDMPERWSAGEAVRFALANNPETAMARQRIAAARANLSEASAAFYPRISFSAAYSRTDNPMYSFGNILNQGEFNDSIDFNDPGITDNLNVAGTINYQLYNGGNDQAAVDSARAAAAASGHEQEAVRAELAFQVVNTFFSIVQAQETLQTRISAVEAITATVDVARARYQAGDLLKADLLSLEVHQSETTENLILARHSLDLTKRAFLNLLGLEKGTVEIESDTGVDQNVPADRSYEGRAELQALAASVEAANARLRQARAGYYPSADAYAGYHFDQGYEFDGSGTSWIAGIKVNFDLFDGSLTSARAAGALARLEETKEKLRRMTLAIHLEIEQATLALQQAEQRMEVTGKMVEQAAESASLSRERFKEGVILSSELIDVENRLTDARVRQAIAHASRRIAVADLRRALGLQQFEDIGSR